MFKDIRINIKLFFLLIHTHTQTHAQTHTQFFSVVLSELDAKYIEVYLITVLFPRIVLPCAYYK